MKRANSEEDRKKVLFPLDITAMLVFGSTGFRVRIVVNIAFCPWPISGLAWRDCVPLLDFLEMTPFSPPSS